MQEICKSWFCEGFAPRCAGLLDPTQFGHRSDNYRGFLKPITSDIPGILLLCGTVHGTSPTSYNSPFPKFCLKLSVIEAPTYICGRWKACARLQYLRSVELSGSYHLIILEIIHKNRARLYLRRSYESTSCRLKRPAW